MFDKHKIINNHKHNALFTVLLCLLPILALNIGYYIIKKIDDVQEDKKRQEVAAAELQSIIYSSSFDFQFTNYSREFSKSIKNIPVSVNDEYIYQYIISEANRVFAYPFPEHELFIFHTSANTTETNLVYPNISKKNQKFFPSKIQLCNSFDYLTNLNKGIESKKISFLRSLTNSLVDVKAYATQKGKPTYTLYKLESHRFVWNYYELDNKEIYGFFLFCKNIEDYETNARQIVLNKKIEENTKLPSENYLKNAIRAYIPVFDHYGKKIYQTKFLEKYEPYQDWEKRTGFPCKNEEIKKREIEGYDNNIIIGNYKLFTQIGNSQSHLCVLLLPFNNKYKIPDIIKSFNILYISLICIFLLRIFLFNQIPAIKLKHRFILNFLLASTLPLSLLIIISYSYLRHTEESNKVQYLSNLANSINEFETRKEKLWDKYVSKIYDTQKNDEFIKLLEKNGTANCSEIKDKLIDIFYTNFDMPLKAVYLADKDGIGTFLTKISNQTESDKDDTNEKIIAINENDPNFDKFIFPICRIISKDTKLQPEMMELVYNTVRNDGELTKDLEKNTGKPMILNMENKSKEMRTFNFINTNKGETKYVILLVWSDEDIDNKSYNEILHSLEIENKEFAYTGYIDKLDGLHPINKEHKIKFVTNSNNKYNLNKEAFEIAKDAMLQKTSITRNIDNYYLTAIPAKNFTNMVFVGACDMQKITIEIQEKQNIIICVFCFSFGIILFCAYITLKIILDPITGLKQALDKISNDNINIKIIGNSDDELGSLCNEFTFMIQGLRERKKLATLISDQAVEALQTGALKTERFNGVALVSDIRNFTGTCETYNANLITELLNNHFAEMSAIISEQGGRIYKYIGDAIEAVFPEDPQKTESASYRAYTAAMRMIVKLHLINRKREHNGLFTYKIGVGLKYGEMFSGTVGSVETRLDYTILGEPLKKAAQLEALSIKNPDYPIVVDKKINEELSNFGLVFDEITTNNIEAYTLNMLSPGNMSVPSANTNNIISKTNKEKTKRNTESNSKRKTSKITIEKIFAGSRFNFLSTKTIFIIIYIFILLTFTSIPLSYYFILDTQKQNDIEQITEKNQRLIEQIKSKSTAPKVVFENICKTICLQIYKIYSSSNRDKKQIEKEFNTYKEKLTKELNFKVLKNRTSDRFARIKADKKNYKYTEGILDNLYTIICPIDNIDKNLKLFIKGFSEPNNNIYIAMQKISSDNKYEYECSEGFDKKILNLTQNTYIINKLKENKNIIINNDYIKINDDNIIFNNDKYRLIVASKIEGSYNKKFNICLTITITIFSLTTLLIYNIYKGKSFINKSIRAKLWLLLISVAIIPITALIITFSFFSIEWQKLEIHNTKSDLKKIIQNTENKETFSYPEVIKYLSQIGKSEELKTEIAKYDEYYNNGQKDKLDEQKNIILGLITKSDNNKYKAPSFGEYEIITTRENGKKVNKHKYSGHYLEELVIVGNNWSISQNSSNQVADLYKEFGKKIKQLSQNSTIYINQSEGNKTNVKEEKVEESLKILSSLFGNRIYLQLPHMVNIPLIFNAGESNIRILTQAIPNIRNSEYSVLWVTLSNPHWHLRDDIIPNYNKKQNYKIYELSRLDHDSINGINKDNPDDFELNNYVLKLSSYISYTLIPINIISNINGKNYYFYAQSCNLPYVCLIASADLTSHIENSKYISNLFYSIIFISILLIIIIAHNVAKDIVEPIKLLITGVSEANKEHYRYRIKSERNDELGILSNSFDKMMKGLEEKHLMGKMVSQTAQTISLKEGEETSRKTDCVLLYVMVKDFDNIAKTISAENLINELKIQVEYIAKAVLEEGGEIDKIMGDKQLIVFHTFNRTLKECLSAACNAALKISKIEKSGALPFKSAIGINYGSVVTGFLGVGEKRDFTVIGDPVNVSARIAAFAGNQETERYLISSDVYDLIKTEFYGKFIDRITLKGKSQPMEIYSLNGKL